jgi:hypothetical protein
MKRMLFGISAALLGTAAYLAIGVALAGAG